MTVEPDSLIQSTLRLWSMNPKTSIHSKKPFSAAHSAMFCTEPNSPSEILAEVTSIRSTRSFFNSVLAILAFSGGVNETPWVCSPSLSVVSIN